VPSDYEAGTDFTFVIDLLELWIGLSPVMVVVDQVADDQ
ncbi:unnamed protein product, partial [marine sediment metagenome]